MLNYFKNLFVSKKKIKKRFTIRDTLIPFENQIVKLKNEGFSWDKKELFVKNYN